jgi:CHAD domain-containing protein
MAKAKTIRNLNCSAPASTGIKLVLATRFNEMLEWRDTALDWTDPEGVHSMRVASRRLRSTLRDFAPYLHKRPLNSAGKKLKRVADTLGEVRDLDVALLALAEIKNEAPPAFVEGLTQFVEAREALRERARESLKAVLEKELPALESQFVAGVDKAATPRGSSNSRKPELTFAEMSRTVILDRLREFEKASSGLFKPLDVDALHDLRIAVKRLRYAIELFQKCWRRSLPVFAKRAARIQTALGDLHDCDVWIQGLGKHINRARKQKQDEQVAALVWLLSHFIKLRTGHMRRALARWGEWERHDTSGRLREILRVSTETGDIPPSPESAEQEQESHEGQEEIVELPEAVVDQQAV